MCAHSDIVLVEKLRVESRIGAQPRALPQHHRPSCSTDILEREMAFMVMGPEVWSLAPTAQSSKENINITGSGMGAGRSPSRHLAFHCHYPQ